MRPASFPSLLLALIAGVSLADASRAAAQTPAAAPALSTACAETTEPVTRETLVPTMREAWALVNARHKAALRCYERIVSAVETVGNTQQQAYANDGYAWALSQAERRMDARRHYTRALALYRQLKDEPNEARALRNIAASHINTNDFPPARELLQQAIAIFTRLGLARDEAIAIEHLAYATSVESPEKDALRLRGLDAARRGEFEEAACGIQHEWGDALFVQGRYGEAVTHLTEAAACFERLKSMHAAGRALVSLGRVQRAHGQLSSALQYYQRALALQQRDGTGNNLSAVQSLNAIAVTYGYLEQPDEALRYYERALAMAKAIDSPDYVGFITGQIGSELVGRGDYARAVAMLEAAIEADPSPTHLAFRWGQLGAAYAHLGRREEALAAAERAVSTARPIGPDALLPALSNRSDVRQRLGRLDEAQADLTEAMTLVETLRANTIATDFMKRGFGQQHQQLYARAIELQVRRGRPQAALEVAEQARARAFLDLLASRAKPAATGVAATSASPASVIAPPGERATPAPLATEPGAQDPTVTSSASHLRAARSGVATVADAEALEQRRALGSDATVAAPTLADVRATARRLKSTLLVYWVGDTGTHVWVVSPAGGVHAARIDATRARLHELVAAATQSTEAAAAGLASFGSTTKPWRDLYQLVIAPVRAHLPREPNSLLTIVPHGPLFQVSFAALLDERGQYLLERYRLHYTPAVGVLSFTAASRRDRPAATATTALLVGDPLPLTPQPGEDPMPPLPWSKREVDEIGGMLPSAQATILTQRSAGEAAVRERVEQAGLLHFATHGVVQQEETLASYLALADGLPDATNGSPSSARSDDGRLTADEVYGLHLRANLVVLSACRTALGPLSGDGVIGFTRAFLYAGAPSVVATSWDVPDEAGYEVMRRFYRARGTARTDTAEALRSAQLSVLQALRKGTFTVATATGRTAPREHPLFWAGFLVVGEP